MPKKSNIGERTVNDIVTGMLKGEPPRKNELAMLGVAYHMRPQAAVAAVKTRLRRHVEHFKSRSVLLRETAGATTNPNDRFGFTGAAFAWDNAANLLNAELNRP